MFDLKEHCSSNEVAFYPIVLKVSFAFNIWPIIYIVDWCMFFLFLYCCSKSTGMFPFLGYVCLAPKSDGDVEDVLLMESIVSSKLKWRTKSVVLNYLLGFIRCWSNFWPNSMTLSSTRVREMGVCIYWETIWVITWLLQGGTWELLFESWVKISFHSLNGMM